MRSTIDTYPSLYPTTGRFEDDCMVNSSLPPTHQGQTGAEAPSRSRKERKPSGVALDWTVRNVIGDRTSVP